MFRRRLYARPSTYLAAYGRESNTRPVDHKSDTIRQKVNMIQIVTGVEVTIGNLFPDVWEILPDAKGGG